MQSDDSSSSESSDSDSDSDASAEEAAGETPKRRRVASTAPARSGRKLQGGGARCADAEDGYSAAELQVARPDVAGDRPLVAAQKMLTLAARPGHAPCRDEEKQVRLQRGPSVFSVSVCGLRPSNASVNNQRAAAAGGAGVRPGRAAPRQARRRAAARVPVRRGRAGHGQDDVRARGGSRLAA